MATTYTRNFAANGDVGVRESKIEEIVFSWTSDAGGAASATTTEKFSGLVLGVETIPAGGGSAPTSYGLTLANSSSTDVLGGAGASRSATANEYAACQSGGVPVPVPITATTLALAITGAGNAKSGTAIVKILRR